MNARSFKFQLLVEETKRRCSYASIGMCAMGFTE